MYKFKRYNIPNTDKGVRISFDKVAHFPNLAPWNLSLGENSQQSSTGKLSLKLLYDGTVLPVRKICSI